MAGKRKTVTSAIKHKTLRKKPDGDSNTRQRKWITKSIEWMKEGWSVKMIKDAIYAQKEGGMARSTIEKIVFEANRIIIQDFSQDRASVTSLHIKRYNKQIKKLLATRDDDVLDEEGQVDKIAGIKKKVNAYFDCLETMFQKEKLLQYHSKSFKIIVNNTDELEIHLPSKTKKLDVKKLTFQERLELYKLMTKAKRTEDEVLGVKLNVRNDEEVIDIDHEVIHETNVDKIQETNIDKISKQGISLEEAALKIRKALQREATKKFQEIGGKIHPDELH